MGVLGTMGLSSYTYAICLNRQGFHCDSWFGDRSEAVQFAEEAMKLPDYSISIKLWEIGRGVGSYSLKGCDDYQGLSNVVGNQRIFARLARTWKKTEHGEIVRG